MTNIYAIVKYDFYGTKYVDILYSKNGYPSYCRTCPFDEMPRTARKWLEGKTGKSRYDKIFKRDTIIYKN